MELSRKLKSFDSLINNMKQKPSEKYNLSEKCAYLEGYDDAIQTFLNDFRPEQSSQKEECKRCGCDEHDGQCCGNSYRKLQEVGEDVTRCCDGRYFHNIDCQPKENRDKYKKAGCDKNGCWGSDIKYALLSNTRPTYPVDFTRISTPKYE